MMDFGRFRFSNDDDIIVIIDDPVVEEEKTVENEDEKIVEITPEMAQDNNNQKLMNKYLNAIGELNFDKKNEKHQEKPSKIETPEEKPIKIVKEDYKNKTLMDKYLHGIGEFKEANYEEEKVEIEEKQPEDLMEKYALDKEVVYAEETESKEEQENTEEVESKEENEEVETKEENEEENGPITVNVEAVDIEDMTPIELTDDLDAPLLPEPADLTEIVENNINTNYDNVYNKEEEKEIDLGETFKDKPVLAKTKVKKLNPFIVLFIIIAFITLGFGGALYVYNSSNKVIVERTLKHLKEYKQYFNKSYVMDDTDELYVTGDVIFNSSDIENPINDLKIKYNFYEDSEKRAADFGIYKNNILKLNSKINFSNQKLYILLDEIYDKYIQVSNYSYSKDELDMEEIISLVDYASLRFTKNIKKENFKSDNAKIVIDNKEISVKETVISLNEKELAEIYNNVIDDIISDAYYNKILRKITKNDVKIDINDINTTNMDHYEFKIYTDKLLGNIKGIDLKVISQYKYYDCEEDLDSYEEECDDFEFEEETTILQYRVGETNEFTLINDDEILIKGNLIADAEAITINLKNAKDKAIGYIKKTTKKTLTTYEIDIVDEDYKVNVELKYQVDEVKQNSEYNIDTTLTIKFTDSEKDTTEFSVNTILKAKNKLDKNIDYVTEYINFDDMESEDFDEIVEKIIDIYYDIFEIEEEDIEENNDDIVLE